jgi:16S rRNA (cytosine967-C5)-methyltransferase
LSEIRAGSWSRSLDAADVRTPRAAAIWVIERCLALRQRAELLEARFAIRLEARDRALVHRLVTDVLRWLRRLDDVLEQAGGREIARIDGRLLGPLRLGAAQLLLLERIPPHAAVSTSVDLAAARSRRGARFVNALLRKIASAGDLSAFPVRARDPIERLAVATSHSDFLTARWVARFGLERATAVLEASNRDRAASLLVVGGREARDGAAARLKALGAEVRTSPLSPFGLLVGGGTPLDTELFRQGEIHPQDEASQCAALIPTPAGNELVLDAAASPGGKSLSLLAFEPTARVVAADAGMARLARLAENRRRTGRRFPIVASDARRPAFASAFDRVLADLPCSGSGTLAKHPELKWRISAGEIARLVEEAGVMLDGLAPLVGPDGRLVVATCSLEPEENEGQVARFLDRHPEFRLEPLEGRVPEGLGAGLEAPGRWRLLPGGDHDGFTVHSLRRVQSP